MADQIRVILRALDRVASQVIRKLALDITAELKKAPSSGGTPVDTGWARANWLTTVATPATAPLGTREAVPTANPGLGQVLAYRTTGQGPVYISNNVPYIGRLNDGYSKQAPAGFVPAAIGRAVRTTVGSVG